MVFIKNSFFTDPFFFINRLAQMKTLLFMSYLTKLPMKTQLIVLLKTYKTD